MNARIAINIAREFADTELDFARALSMRYQTEEENVYAALGVIGGGGDDFFSSEVALTAKEIVLDYGIVGDECDADVIRAIQRGVDRIILSGRRFENGIGG